MPAARAHGFLPSKVFELCRGEVRTQAYQILAFLLEHFVEHLAKERMRYVYKIINLVIDAVPGKVVETSVLKVQPNGVAMTHRKTIGLVLLSV